MMKKYLFLLALMFLIPLGLIAQEDTENGENTEEVELSEDHFSVYHAGIFLGATTNLEHDATDFTLGLDYEYRLPYIDYLFGVGFVIEAVFAEHKESILAIPVTIHPPLGDLKFYFAPGIMFGDKVVETPVNTHDVRFNKKPVIQTEVAGPVQTEFKTHFLFRIGLGYDFHIDRFAISPTVAFDVIEGKFSAVYGLTLGMGL